MLYVPNLIGYARFILNIASVPFAYNTSDGNNWIIFLVLYSSSQLLDAIDGAVARKLNQASRFGAALDMISDRTSCGTVYMILMFLYQHPWYSYLFLICFILDFGSHFLQFCSSAVMKSESHKGKNTKENFLVHYYYNNNQFFMMIVVCSEVCSVFLVIMQRSKPFQESNVAYVTAAFLCLNLSTKMIINVFQWQGAV